MYICSTTASSSPHNVAAMTTHNLEIVNPHITHYLLEMTPERDAVLSEMEAYATQHEFPIVGPLVGRFLALLAASINAKRILELGSGFGYSAYWFAQAIADDATIICTDTRSDNAKLAMEWFRRAHLAHKIDFRVGEALTVLKTIEGEFDIIFNDIEKENYPRVLSQCISRLRKGGLLISDNVLWKGRILADKPDQATAGVLMHNRRLYAMRELYTVILPLRDGVSVSLKVA